MTPQYARYPGNHVWLCTIDKKGKTRSFNGGEPDVSFPDSVYVPIGQKGGTTKVYRITFAKQKSALTSKIPQEKIPQFFKNSNIIDVTDEYNFPQATVKFDLKVKPPEGCKYVFLCDFGLSYQIVPLAYVKYTGNSVQFSNVGTNGIYFPVYCSNDQFIVAGNPKVFDADGSVGQLTPNMSKLVTVKLNRKYPSGFQMWGYAKWLLGSKLQASDDKDFKNPVTFLKIDTVLQHFVERDNLINKKFRYYRFLASDTGKLRLAEVDFIPQDMANTLNKSKKFKVYGYAKEDGEKVKPVFENAFDGDITTNFNAPASSWVAIDFGKPVKISRIRYLVRNDQNIVVVGDEYELLYFDMGWNSLGKQKAEHNYLIYNKVPANAVLLLRDLTEGRQERIFVNYVPGDRYYQKETQGWW